MQKSDQVLLDSCALAMQALSSLWSTEARSDRNNMAPRAALKFWASAGIRMPWIEPLTWAYVALSVFVYAFLWVDTERAAVLTKDWVAFVIGRNLAIYFIFYGGAHHFLYESTLAKDLAGKDLKWNPKYPGDGTKSAKEIPGGWAPLGLTLKLILTRRGAELSRIAQHSHDRFWCLTSCVVSSLIEVYFIHAWASGSLPVLADSEVFGLGSVAHLMVAPFWRTVHFYAVHRAIHSKLLYLLRKILALNDPHKSAPVIYINVFRSRYKNVHYLHHRSKNTAPWCNFLYCRSTIVRLLFD